MISIKAKPGGSVLTCSYKYIQKLRKIVFFRDLLIITVTKYKVFELGCMLFFKEKRDFWAFIKDAIFL
ncbi:MAG: hypothetical protein AUK31_00845 [Fibrobacteres bacterium CG2_30_45_31]|nr:MAG: hypothetical protein AUK31_00845 [Fibrobacteres bacterium CG2_30_45_31]